MRPQIVKDEILHFPLPNPPNLLITVSRFHRFSAFPKTLKLQGMFRVKHPLQDIEHIAALDRTRLTFERDSNSFAPSQMR